MSGARLLAWQWLALVIACNDYPNQLVVAFDTDALVVPETPTDAFDAPTPLFDRLRIDILPPCDGCSRDFAVTAEMFARKEVSIGVPLPQQAVRLRARLYLSRLSPSGEPNPDSTIDMLVALPTADQNPGSAGVFLATDDVGVAKDPNGDAADALGPAFDSSRVGTWWGSPPTKVGCDDGPGSQPRPANTACVPGGAYFMGSQDGQQLAVRSGGWHRLAVLSPFFLDTNEVTVGALRASGLTLTKVSFNDPNDPVSQYCSFTTTPGPYESFPMNCIPFTIAEAYCASLGGALPTGTQLEYVATHFGQSPYVWGHDEPSCDAAIWANCRAPHCSPTITSGTQQEACFDNACPTIKDANGVYLGGPQPAACCHVPPCTFRDALQVGDTDVIGLSGDLGEISSDELFSESDPCYADTILQDPSCPAHDVAQVRAGSFFVDSPRDMRGDVVRSYGLILAFSTTTISTGFRCAYPATPKTP